jgi:beta-glucanase (GH16 family)
VFTDFTKGSSNDWTLANGTTLSYGSDGAEFKIVTSTDAPTISSSKYIFFGQVDVFLRAAPGTGVVSSFILESDDLDEIDWEWLGSTDSSVESNFFGKGNTTTYDRAIYHNVATPIETYHNYSITWTAASTEWYIDGALVRTLNYGDALALGGKNYPQTPMRIKMGNWVGCADAAAASNPATAGTCSWAGGPGSFPNSAGYTMLVSNVTITDFGCGGDYTYSDMTGDWQSIKSSGTCGSSSSSGSSSVSSSSSKSSTSTTSSASVKSSSGGVLAQTSASGNSTTSTSTAQTTLSTATTTGSSSKTTGSSTTSSGAAKETTSDATTTKSKYGVVDFAVIALGLGLGYLVM